LPFAGRVSGQSTVRCTLGVSGFRRHRHRRRLRRWP